jgi:hypothetical protein
MLKPFFSDGVLFVVFGEKPTSVFTEQSKFAALNTCRVVNAVSLHCAVEYIG